MSVLVLAEHDGNCLNKSALATVTCARQLGNVHVMVVGADCGAAAQAAAQVDGVERVLYCDDSRYIHPLAAALAPLLAVVAPGYSHILASATSLGKDLMPRVAAMLDVEQISDVIAVLSPDTFKRPIYAGNAVATVQTLDAVKVLTVRATAFGQTSVVGGTAVVESISAAPVPVSTRFVSRDVACSARPKLTDARVVISGGRGMGSAQGFRLLDRLADELGAAIGASRAAVDAGYAPNDWQVGQTGKIVAPELYIAIGISGAIQHLAGMKDSKVIVAINKDADAPIFQFADYGLVADLFQVIDELSDAFD